MNKYSLNTIYFYLTRGCNLRCCHCWINPKYQTKDNIYPSLDIGLFKSIINQAKPLGLYSVKLTGGEPLLHPKIKDILKYIKQEDLRLNMETNGVLCSKKIAKAISQCKNPFVSVSIDSTNPERHDQIRGVKGSFKKSCQGIKNLVNEGIRPQLIMSVFRYNKSDFKSIVRLAESLSCDSVKFNMLMINGRAKKMYKSGKLPSIKELIEIGNWIEKILINKTNLPILYNHPPAFRPLSQIIGKQRYFPASQCGIFNSIGVLADGSYALCGIGQTVKELIFGHAEKDDLKDIWNQNKTIKKIQEGLPNNLKGICKKCIMNELCKGYCIAENYALSKDLFAGYWYCEEAYKKGLFPETRIKN